MESFKRFLTGGLFLVLVSMAFVGCASAPRATSTAPHLVGGYPKTIQDAVNETPDEYYVGVGSAESKTAASKSIAATRARASIAQQLETVIKDLVEDYNSSSEAHSDLEAFQSEITVAIAQADLVGNREIGYFVDENNIVWVAIRYSREEAKKLISQSTRDSGKLNESQKQALSAEDRLEKWLEKAN
ncbi:hypothetical protein AGMMS49940_21220 [Spirochaetia bacterium]|nr:hypothetical protein AGMMS49940_21220 [Spirochaetia bacterium]